MICSPLSHGCNVVIIQVTAVSYIKSAYSVTALFEKGICSIPSSYDSYALYHSRLKQTTCPGAPDSQKEGSRFMMWQLVCVSFINYK